MKVFFQKHPKLKVTLISIGIFTVFILLTWKFWYTQMIGVTALVITSDSQVVNIKPQPKVFSENLVPFGRDFLFNGVIISTPWIDVTKIRDGDLVLAVNFGENSDRAFGLFEDIGEYDHYLEEGAEVAAVWGENIDSNYEYQREMLNTTRADLSFPISREKVVPTSFLLILKEVTTPLSLRNLYEFENKHRIRGFEYVSATSSIVKFYTSEDKPYMLSIRGANQDEVDFIIQSLRSY